MIVPEYLHSLAAVYFLIFVIREIIAYKGIRFFKYLLTPMITAIAVFIVLLSIGFYGIDRYNLMIFSSLLAALVADTLLMLEETNYLKNGIIFFMMSHLLYITAFGSNVTFKPWNIIILVIICFINFFLIRAMKKHAGGMLIPVSLYVLMIDIMGYLALTKLNNGAGQYEVALASAAVLFWISDLILSINTFVKKVPHSTVYTWLFYAPAQFLFAMSTILIHHV